MRKTAIFTGLLLIIFAGIALAQRPCNTGIWKSTLAYTTHNCKLVYTDLDGKGIYHISTWIDNSAAPIPEPSTCLLLGIGLLGMVGYGWRRNRK